MTLQALKNIQRSQQQQGNGDEPRNFPALLEKFKGEIGRALPRHINPDRMVRIALTAFRMNPKLSECNPRSVFAAIIQSSQLGLEVGLMGEAHLVPFKNECQLIPGYTGLIKLARQSGFVQDIYAHEVRMNDEFVLNLGLERNLEHIPLSGKGGFPASDEERGEIVGFYAVAVFKDGSRTFVAMSLGEVERIRDNSRGYKSAKQFRKESVWDTDFVAMGLKTAIRRLCKYLPKSPELATALSLGDVVDQGKEQHLDLTGDFVPMDSNEEEAVEAEYVSTDGDSHDSNDPVLKAAVMAMEKAKTVEALDAMYHKLESDYPEEGLEVLVREYERIKQKLTK